MQGDDDQGGQSPRPTEKTRGQAEARRERLAEALRANLARRKAQTRRRTAAAGDGDGPEGEEGS